MMTEFERHAWKCKDKSNDHRPEQALKAALDDIERGKLPREAPTLKHAIVILITANDDMDDVLTFYQAGQLSSYAAEGAVGRTLRILQTEN